MLMRQYPYSICLKYWLKGAIIPRLIGIVFSIACLALWFKIYTDLEKIENAILYALPTGLSLYLGSKIDLMERTNSPPSWSKGFYSSLLVFMTSLLLIDYSLLPLFGFPFGLFINISYLGAKIGCMNLGCCGIKSIKDRHFYGWKIRPRLQSFEVICTIIILLLSGILFIADHPNISGFTLIFSHGVLRIFSGTYRFPYKPIRAFLKEPSGGGIIIVGLIPIFCPPP